VIVQVHNIPLATIIGDTLSCANSTIVFTSNIVSADLVNVKNWTCSNGSNGTGNSFTVNFPNPGQFTIRLIAGTINGCYDTSYHVIQINPLPTASISGNATVCLGATAPLITFTGNGSIAPYTFSYKINNGPIITITTISGNSISIPAPTNTAGTFTYTLLSVQDGSITACTQPQSGTAVITVNPSPLATITGGATVCVGNPAPLITFTGSGSTAPYTFTYNINNGPYQTITTTSGNAVSIQAPTNLPGTFIYNLVSVSDGSSTNCSQPQTGTVTILVNPLPTATINGNAAVCLGNISPIITFTGNGSTAPYTFIYKINNGPNLSITSTNGNTATVSAPTNIAGTFIYTLVSVQDASSTACMQPQAGTATIVVNPLPLATITGGATLCAGSPLPIVTFTGSGSTAPYTFTYNINNGPNLTVTTTSGNTVTITAPTNIAGTFVYTLISVQDGSTTACSQLQNGAVTIIINPLPTATISGSTAVCLGAASPVVTFTGAGSTAPYTFTYKNK
jgi:hypothetical protein